MTKKIVEVTRLPSGNVKVYARSKKAKEKLQKDSAWTSTIVILAVIQQQTFTITAHGIRVENINTAD